MRGGQITGSPNEVTLHCSFPLEYMKWALIQKLELVQIAPAVSTLLLSSWSVDVSFGSVVRVLMSSWQPLGPAHPSRLGRCTSYRLEWMGVGTGFRLLVFVALAQVKSLGSCDWAWLVLLRFRAFTERHVRS